MQQSIRIIEQLLDNIPEGEFQAKTKAVLKLPKGELGYSMPIFWWGLLLIMFVSFYSGLLPVSGRIDLINYSFDQPTGFMTIDALLSDQKSAFLDALRHLILPAIVLGTIPLAIIARMTRSSMLEVLSEDYVRTARPAVRSNWRRRSDCRPRLYAAEHLGGGARRRQYLRRPRIVPRCAGWRSTGPGDHRHDGLSRSSGRPGNIGFRASSSSLQPPCIRGRAAAKDLIDPASSSERNLERWQPKRTATSELLVQALWVLPWRKTCAPPDSRYSATIRQTRRGFACATSGALPPARRARWPKNAGRSCFCFRPSKRWLLA